MSFRKYWPQYLSTFVIGVAVGAGAALLLTPLTGRKMQKKVIETVEDLKVAALKMAS